MDVRIIAASNQPVAQMVKSGKKVAVKFFSPFCDHCQEASPEVDRAASRELVFFAALTRLIALAARGSRLKSYPEGRRHFSEE